MYVPVLKNRQEEMNALKALYSIPISNKIFPLLEIVQAKSRENSKKTPSEELKECINPTTDFMVDILNVEHPKKSKEPINNFLLNIRQTPNFRINLFNSLKDIKNVVPVVTYDTDTYSLKNKEIEKESKLLRTNFSRLAFRIKIKHLDHALSEVANSININDVIIFDIHHTTHSNPILKSSYNKIKNLATAKSATTIIINSIIPEDFTNSSIVNGAPILEIDNSLRDSYAIYGFNGFGDYATIKDSLPSNGGTISPGFLFYSFKNNFFAGFKGIQHDLSSFISHIIPTLEKSPYWKEYSRDHLLNCPGCKTILDIKKASLTGKSQGLWKRISIMHYIYTIDKYLP